MGGKPFASYFKQTRYGPTGHSTYRAADPFLQAAQRINSQREITHARLVAATWDKQSVQMQAVRGFAKDITVHGFPLQAPTFAPRALAVARFLRVVDGGLEASC